MERHLVQSLVRGALLGHPDLGMAGGHRRGDLRRIGGGHEPHDHTGMLGAEAADDRGHRIGREGRERRHVEVTGDQAGDGRDGRGRRLDVAQRLAGRIEQRLARGRQRRAPPAPHEEVGAQLGLELPDGERHRRLGHVGGAGTGRETAVVGDGQEQAEAPEIHKETLSIVGDLSDCRVVGSLRLAQIGW